MPRVAQLLHRGLGALESLSYVWRTRALSASPGPGTTGLVSIYRRRNRATIERLVAEAEQLGTTVALWALDDPIPALEAVTIGRGPGMRMTLLNRLWQGLSGHDLRQLVIADDDFYFSRGSLARLLGMAAHCGFAIAQPAHDWPSQCSYRFTRQRHLALARQTTFVEPGPIFVVQQPWLSQVLPLPGDFGMGWGLWLLWRDLLNSGCRLGIVDGACVRHVSPVATSYAADSECRRLHALLRERGLQRPLDAQSTLAVWRPWQASPPWLCDRSPDNALRPVGERES